MHILLLGELFGLRGVRAGTRTHTAAAHRLHLCSATCRAANPLQRVTAPSGAAAQGSGLCTRLCSDSGLALPVRCAFWCHYLQYQARKENCWKNRVEWSSTILLLLRRTAKTPTRSDNTGGTSFNFFPRWTLSACCTEAVEESVPNFRASSSSTVPAGDQLRGLQGPLQVLMTETNVPQARRL